MTTWHNVGSSELAQHEGNEILVDGNATNINWDSTPSFPHETIQGVFQRDNNGKAFLIAAIYNSEQECWINLNDVEFKWWTTLPKFKDATCGGG